jgi:peptide-methionine (S)-S-oxide reductase
MAQNKSEESEAVFGLQCFWGAEVKFATVKGVISTKVGYTGGTTANPSYKDLSDHTEVVAVKFDPNIITYEVFLLINV